MAVPEPCNLNAFRPTSTKYRQHFADLVRWGILKPIERGTGALKFISRYFSVPKNPDVERAIFNGHAFSKHCRTPPTVNLASVGEVIHEVNKIAREGPLYVFLSDIRHWFHQIPLASRVWRFFGVAMKNLFGETEYFGWRTLPMGW